MIVKKFCILFELQMERSDLRLQTFSTLDLWKSLRVFSIHGLAMKAGLTNWHLLCPAQKAWSGPCKPFAQTVPQWRLMADTAFSVDA